MKNKFGICAWTLPVSLPDVLETIAAWGLDGFIPELTLSADGLLNLSDKETAEELKARAQDNHLEIPTLGLNFLCDLGMPNPDNESRIFQLLDESLRVAVFLGARTLQIPSFFDSTIRSPSDFDQTARCLEYICRKAGSAGISVGWENALSAEENLAMIRLLDQENFFPYFDTQNPLRFGNLDNVALATVLRPHTREIHLKDSHDDPSAAVRLGEGTANFHACVKALEPQSFHGWVSLESEYKNFGNLKDIDVLVRNDIALMKNLFK